MAIRLETENLRVSGPSCWQVRAVLCPPARGWEWTWQKPLGMVLEGLLFVGAVYIHQMHIILACPPGLQIFLKPREIV